MAIQIVQTEEKLTYMDEGSEIYYRRIPTLRRSAIVKKYTKRGKANWAKVTEAILLYVILGWKDVECAGAEISFSPELIASLPEDTVLDILNLSGGSSPETAGGSDGGSLGET